MEPSSDYARTIESLLTRTLPQDKDNLIKSLILQVIERVPPKEEVRLWGLDTRLPFALNATDREEMMERWNKFLPVKHSSFQATARKKRRDSPVRPRDEPESAKSTSKRTSSVAFGTNPWRYWDPSAPAPPGIPFPDFDPEPASKLPSTGPFGAPGPLNLDPNSPPKPSPAKRPRRSNDSHVSTAAPVPPPPKQSPAKRPRLSTESISATIASESPSKQSPPKRRRRGRSLPRYRPRIKQESQTDIVRKPPHYQTRRVTTVKTDELLGPAPPTVDDDKDEDKDSNATLSMEEGVEHDQV